MPRNSTHEPAIFMSRILIVDDEPDISRILAKKLQLEGHTVATADSGSDGLRRLEAEEFDVAVTDVRLPDVSGVDLTTVIKARYPAVEIICLTAFGNIADGVRAIKNGAFDYLVKGDDNDRIPAAVARAAEKARLQYRVRRLEETIRQQRGFGTITGSSPALRHAVDLARRVAATDATVLLTGQTGVGKEVFAQAIHAESPNSGEPFVAINCSALSRDLLESELFGHKAGAFTGATRDKKGLFEEADRGTLFLDEVGELSPDLQAKLLRVLESGTFIRVGETKETHVKVRIIAATNRDLFKECEEKRFREDLYFRLSVFHIPLPSLNERREDIPQLVDLFLARFSAKLAKRITAATPAFLAAVQGHNWTGNIRELRNIVERAAILCEGDTLTDNLLPFDFNRREKERGNGKAEESLRLKDSERCHIARVLRIAEGNKTKTAELLEISISTLYAKIKEYDL